MVLMRLIQLVLSLAITLVSGVFQRLSNVSSALLQNILIQPTILASAQHHIMKMQNINAQTVLIIA